MSKIKVKVNLVTPEPPTVPRLKPNSGLCKARLKRVGQWLKKVFCKPSVRPE
jgi:hypothetical protein